MRRFKLIRARDVSGVSGTGHVADGVMFADGVVTTHWIGATVSTAIWNRLADMLAVHGHGGSTWVEWIDE